MACFSMAFFRTFSKEVIIAFFFAVRACFASGHATEADNYVPIRTFTFAFGSQIRKIFVQILVHDSSFIRSHRREREALMIAIQDGNSSSLGLIFQRTLAAR